MCRRGNRLSIWAELCLWLVGSVMGSGVLGCAEGETRWAFGLSCVWAGRNSIWRHFDCIGRAAFLAKIFEVTLWECFCMISVQFNVDFEYQLRIYSWIEETHRKSWWSQPVAGPSWCTLISSHQPGLQTQTPPAVPTQAVALFTNTYKLSNAQRRDCLTDLSRSQRASGRSRDRLIPSRFSVGFLGPRASDQLVPKIHIALHWYPTSQKTHSISITNKRIIFLEDCKRCLSLVR